MSNSMKCHANNCNEKATHILNVKVYQEKKFKDIIPEFDYDVPICNSHLIALKSSGSGGCHIHKIPLDELVA